MTLLNGHFPELLSLSAHDIERHRRHAAASEPGALLYSEHEPAKEVLTLCIIYIGALVSTNDIFILRASATKLLRGHV